MKIKHSEILKQTERCECCLQTFEMLSPSGKSSILFFDSVLFYSCKLFQSKHKTIIQLYIIMFQPKTIKCNKYRIGF